MTISIVVKVPAHAEFAAEIIALDHSEPRDLEALPVGGSILITVVPGREGLVHAHAGRDILVREIPYKKAV